MKRNDFLLAAGVILTAAVILSCQFVRGNNSGAKVIVSVDGDVYGTYSLKEDQSIEIGNTNRIRIKNGTVMMEKADCPDQICVKHRPVSRVGDSIICLPNKVVISIEGKKQSEGLDGIVQ